MTQAVQLDPDPRIAALLMRHPGVVAARIRLAEDGVVEARVLPAPGRSRIAARGRCALIDAGGSVLEGQLVDLSWSGVCVRLEHTVDRAPDLDTEVQLWIEAEALGKGVDGWLGRVRWARGRDVGVSFEGNVDQGGPLLKFVEAFASVADRVSALDTPETGRPLRVTLDRRAVVHVGAARLDARTVDVSATGVGLRLAMPVHLDLRTRDVRLQIDAKRLWDDPFAATAARQDGDRIGLAVRSDAPAASALAALTEREAALDTVSTQALQDWLRGFGVRGAVRVLHVAASDLAAYGE